MTRTRNTMMRTTSLIGRRAMRLAAITAAAGALTGCVSQGEYDKLWETNRSLTDRMQQLQADLNGCQAENAQLAGSSGSASGVIANLNAENNRLRDQLNASMTAMQDLENRLGNLELGRLDPTTDRALADLARAYPDLIIYDGDRGMLRFASDLTFGSGSDQLQGDALNGLNTLAGVLTGSSASGYDIIIVGHTDSQPISSGTARRHPSNMHLSAHRAISVRKALGEGGVPWDRMQASGWGEHRPVVANNARGGTAQNRRVEIYLTPAIARSVTEAPVQDAAVDTNDRMDIDPTK